MDNDLYISQIRLGDTYNIKDTTSGYVTRDVNNLNNYRNNNYLTSHYQTRLQAGTNITFTPVTIEEEGEDINVIRVSARNTEYNVANTSTDGLMSKEDKSKLNGIDTNAQVNAISKITYNGTELGITNKTVNIEVPITTFQINGVAQSITNNAINLLVGDDYGSNNKIATMHDLPVVNDGILLITVGGASYGYFTANGSENITLPLAKVALTGDFNDLDNKPSELTINDGVLTITVNGDSMGTFTANSAEDVGIDITVPTTLGQLDFTEISGYNEATTQTLKHVNGVLTWV